MVSDLNGLALRRVGEGVKNQPFSEMHCCDIMLLKGVVFNMNDLMQSRIGEKYGKLKIVALEKNTYPSGKKYYKYRCECECGREVSIFVHNWKKSKTCGKCISDSKLKKSPKGIVYHRKYDAYQVRIGANSKQYAIGMFKEFDVAEKVYKEALQHLDNIEYWIEHERENYILSVCPEYKFRHKNVRAATEQQKALFAKRNARMLTDTMKETLDHLKKSNVLRLKENRWWDNDWSCTLVTLNALHDRDLVYFNEDKTECYLCSDASEKLENMKNAHRG